MNLEIQFFCHKNSRQILLYEACFRDSPFCPSLFSKADVYWSNPVLYSVHQCRVKKKHHVENLNTCKSPVSVPQPANPSSPPALLLPPWLVPPALRPDGEQGLGQPLQAQTGQGRSHGEPHVTGPGLTRRPGCLENQLGLLQGAVQQTDLEKGEREVKAMEGGK